MAVTIHVNGKSNSLVHKGSMGIAKSTLPDVCKTPSPGGPVPVPYPVIVSMSSDLKKGTKTVKVDGKNPAAVKGSEFSRCTGDEPGTAGGVKSGTNMKEATWLLYSFDVKLDGKNACRLSDKMMMNHGNTVCLSGEQQQDCQGDESKPKKEPCAKCGKHHKDLENLNAQGNKTAASQIKSGLATFRRHKDVTESDWDKDLCDLAQQDDKSSQTIIKLVKQQVKKIRKLKTSQRRGRH